MTFTTMKSAALVGACLAVVDALRSCKQPSTVGCTEHLTEGMDQDTSIFCSETFSQFSKKMMFCDSDAKSFGCDIFPVHLCHVLLLSPLDLRTLP